MGGRVQLTCPLSILTGIVYGNLIIFFHKSRTVGHGRDLILGDDALLYIACVMYIWASLIPATRWSCSQPPADSNDCWLQLHLVAGMRGAQISITGLVLSASSPNIRSLVMVNSYRHCAKDFIILVFSIECHIGYHIIYFLIA